MKTVRIGNKDYSLTFFIAQIAGVLLVISGLVLLIFVSQMKFGLTNLQPLMKLAVSIVLIIAGFVTIGLSYSIRWKRMVLDRLTALEKGENI